MIDSGKHHKYDHTYFLLFTQICNHPFKVQGFMHVAYQKIIRIKILLDNYLVMIGIHQVGWNINLSNVSLNSIFHKYQIVSWYHCKIKIKKSTLKKYPCELMLFDIYNIPPYPTSMFMFMKRDIFLFTVIVLEKTISILKNSNFKIENVA